jgi:hypothetical protein
MGEARRNVRLLASQMGGTLSLTVVNERTARVIDVTAYPLLAEHARGDSYRAIGERHGLSHEGARQVVMRDSTVFLDRLEMDLLLAWKLEQQGRAAEAQWPGLALPHQPGDGWQLGLALFQWIVDKLKARDLDVQVQTQATPNGVVFLITLVTLGVPYDRHR